MSRDLTGTAVLFDLDGTLVDTAADLAAAMNNALATAGHAPIDPALVRHLVGLGARRMLEQGFALNGGKTPSPAEMDGHVDVFLEHYIAHIADRSRPFPGAVEAVGALRAGGARIAICTNKRERLARLLLDALGLSDLFDAVVGADTIGVGKPDPAPVRFCLQETGARRGVFIGDSDTDIRAARAAGLPCLVALFGYGPLTLKETARATFRAYDALPALVREALK